MSARIFGLRVLLLVMLAAWYAPAVAWAQKAPRIGYVYPAGGQQGQTFQITIGGQYLAGASDIYCSGAGFEATVVSHQRPLSGKETELLRDKLKTLEEKVAKQSSGTPAAHAEEIAAIKEKLAAFANGRPFNTAIAENLTVQVTLARDAKLGDQEIRIATPGGLSNPLVFCVGQLPEFCEPAAKGSLKAEIDARPGRRSKTASDAMAVTLPAVLNGQILAGDADRFCFKAQRGQRILVAASARKLIPYIPDAVPGWFQATVSIHDAERGELAFADDFRFNPDPALCYVIPKDGEYEIEVRDSIYRGREDFVYRISAGELPFITSIFPLGRGSGGQRPIELRGWNLPSGLLMPDIRGSDPGVQSIVAIKGKVISNFVPFAVDTLPDDFEKEPNNVTGGAQSVNAPVVVNGRIDTPGDVDVFRIQGKAGDELVAEIHARRLNSPLDSVLTLTDSGAQLIASNDDFEDKAAGLTTHHADSRLSAKLPADGFYFLQVTDAQRAGGPEHGYRLRVSPPQPDFALRVAPSSISGRAGSNVPVTVFALRRDGFAGEIAIALEDAPEGFKLSGGVIPAGKDQTKLTLTLSQSTADPVALQVEGRAKIGGSELTRRAVAADDMQQAFAYHHLVSARSFQVAVAGRLVSNGSARITTATPIKIPADGTAKVRFAGAFSEPIAGVQFEPIDAAAGFSVAAINAVPEGVELELRGDPAKLVAGEKGNLIVHAFSAAAGKSGKPRRIPLGALPSIPFEIVAP